MVGGYFAVVDDYGNTRYSFREGWEKHMVGRDFGRYWAFLTGH